VGRSRIPRVAVKPKRFKTRKLTIKEMSNG